MRFIVDKYVARQYLRHGYRITVEVSARDYDYGLGEDGVFIDEVSVVYTWPVDTLEELDEIVRDNWAKSRHNPYGHYGSDYYISRYTIELSL